MPMSPSRKQSLVSLSFQSQYSSLRLRCISTPNFHRRVYKLFRIFLLSSQALLYSRGLAPMSSIVSSIENKKESHRVTPPVQSENIHLYRAYIVHYSMIIFKLLKLPTHKSCVRGAWPSQVLGRPLSSPPPTRSTSPQKVL